MTYLIGGCERGSGDPCFYQTPVVRSRGGQPRPWEPEWSGVRGEATCVSRDKSEMRTTPKGWQRRAWRPRAWRAVGLAACPAHAAQWALSTPYCVPGPASVLSEPRVQQRGPIANKNRRKCRGEKRRTQEGVSWGAWPRAVLVGRRLGQGSRTALPRKCTGVEAAEVMDRSGDIRRKCVASVPRGVPRRAAWTRAAVGVTFWGLGGCLGGGRLF